MKNHTRAAAESKAHRAAKLYARNGWRVFPIYEAVGKEYSDLPCSCREADCSSPGKHPRVGQGHNAATKDIDQIDTWWGKWPTANIGVALPPNILVLDVDPRHGGTEYLEELDLLGYEVPDTLEGLTGGGGRHLFLRAPRPIQNCSGLGKRQGLDIRTGGGYVVLPPSNHESGKTYRWKGGKPTQPMAEAPEWIYQLREGTLAPPGMEQPTRRATAGTQEALDISTPLEAGSRNSDIFRMACSLVNKHDLPGAIKMCMLRNSKADDPMSAKEVEETVAKAFTQHEAKSGCLPYPEIVRLVREGGFNLTSEPGLEAFVMMVARGSKFRMLDKNEVTQLCEMVSDSEVKGRGVRSIERRVKLAAKHEVEVAKTGMRIEGGDISLMGQQKAAWKPVMDNLGVIYVAEDKGKVFLSSIKSASSVQSFETAWGSLDFFGLDGEPVRFSVRAAVACDAIAKADRFGFKPGAELLFESKGAMCVNQFDPPLVKEAHGDVTRLYDYIKFLTGDDDAAKLLLDMLALCLQEPTERWLHMPILFGAPGCGKNVWVDDVVKQVIGPRNYTSLQAKNLSLDHTGWLGEGQVLCFPEFELDKGTAAGALNLLKTACTDPEIFLNVKYGGQFSIEMFANFIACANKPDCIAGDISNRRFVPIFCAAPGERARGHKGFGWYVSFKDWVLESIHPIRWALMQRDLTDWRLNPLLTGDNALKTLMEEDSHAHWFLQLRDATNDPESLLNQFPLFPLSTLLNIAGQDDDDFGGGQDDNSRMALELLQLGFRKWAGGSRGRLFAVSHKGGQETIWLRPGADPRYLKCGREQAKRMLLRLKEAVELVG